MSGALQPVLFGKLPSRGDFLRAGQVDEALCCVESWLTAAVEQSRGQLAAEPVRFLHSHAGEALLGCWVPSRDAIGRHFPLACFERVPRDAAELGWSLLFGLHEEFFAAAEALLSRACSAAGAAGLEALQGELAALARPHPSELVRAASDAQARLAAEPIARFAQRALGTAEAMPYALLTLREAARQASAEVTLDVPAASASDLFVWLELAGCSAPGGSRLPAVIWCPQQTRALLATKEPSPSVMAFLVNRRHASNSRWPVWTDRPAGTRALQELTPAVRDVLAAGSLAELVTVLRERAG